MLTGALPEHSTNVDEELGRIQLALATVYAAPSTTARAQSNDDWYAQRQLADRYLTSFQRTSISWMVCDRLLQQQSQSPNNNDAVSSLSAQFFFAAQTLHTKCRNDATELPPAALHQLRDSVLHHLDRHAPSRNHALLNRLALCLSAVAVQMGWTTILHDLQASPHLLLILQTLPEETASSRLHVDSVFRFAMRDHLIGMSSAVTQLLTKLDDLTLETAIAYVRFVPMPAPVLASWSLVPTCLQCLSPASSNQHEHLETATDLLVELLRMYPSHRPENAPLVQAMLPMLQQFPLETVLQGDDDDLQRAYTRLLTEAGEAYLSWILNAAAITTGAPRDASPQELVTLVLRCTHARDLEVASMTLYFWYRFVVQLEQVQPYPNRQALVDVYTSHLVQLVDVCVTHLLVHPDDGHDLSEEELDDWTRHVFYVRETLEDCCRMLGGQAVLQRVGYWLKLHVDAANETADHDRTTNAYLAQWTKIEACLTALVAIVRFVSSDEAELLPATFALIPQLPQDVRPLRITCSELVGKFAASLQQHPALLQPLLPYLAQGLHLSTDIAAASAVAIKELCECSNQTVALAEPVMELYGQVVNGQFRLDIRDELQLLEGVCRALSRHVQDLRQDNGRETLGRLAQPLGQNFATALQDDNATPRKLIPHVDRLTAIVRFLHLPTSPGQSHPLLELMSWNWSLLDAATARFPADNMLAEKVCRLHKHALRAIGGRAYAPMLDNLMQQLVTSYRASHQAPYLYAASICITEYAYDTKYQDKLFGLVVTLLEVTFSFMRAMDDFVKHPDVVEELFYLVGRLVTYVPDRFIQSPLLPSLLQCAGLSMQLDHHGANKGTYKFLRSLVSYGLKLREHGQPECETALSRALQQEGQVLVQRMGASLLGALPSYSEELPDILWKLNLLLPSQLATWLQAALSDHAGTNNNALDNLMAALDADLQRGEFAAALDRFQIASNNRRRP